MIASTRPSSPSSISALRSSLGMPGSIFDDVLERAHLADLAHLVEEVLERELALAQLLGRLLGLLGVEGGLGLLDQREHVAHAEDAAGHPVGMERLEVLELLAGTDEQDRLADDLLHRQRGTTAGVAVDLREDHAVETDRVVERRRRR